MAVVTTVETNYALLTGKNLSRQSALVSKIKEAVVCVAVGACMYPACAAGFTVDLSLCGRITTIIEARPDNMLVGACCNTLLVSSYVPAACSAAATGTLHLYQGPSCVGVLSEICDCSCLAVCKTVKIPVTGF